VYTSNVQTTKRIPEQTKGVPPWKLVIKPRLRKVWGYCDYANREVVMARSTEKHGVARRVFMHEVIHKVCPWMDEDAVDHLSTHLDDAMEAAESVIIM
jgi:hypothetical protein